MKFFRFSELSRRFMKPINVNAVMDEESTLGNRAADAVADTIGSWRFIIIQSVILSFWLILNVTAWVSKWDPYPFILMNLVLSTQAAYSAPIIMMSQNRQAKHDRLEAHNDFLVDQQTGENVAELMRRLETQDALLKKMMTKLEAIEAGLQA